MSVDKILVVEDEADILATLEYNLAREGYTVLSARGGLEAVRVARREAPDLILLDLMLPGLDGIEVCRRLKQDDLTREIPIIMLTAKAEESDIVLGLGVGADDYVTKPFSPREVIARIKAVARRVPVREHGDQQERIVLPHIVIDISRHEIVIAGTPVDFTPTETRLLHFLASHPGRVFTRDQLLSRVIGDGAYVIDRNIDVHVRSVRSKLGEHRDLIQTVRGVGYRFKDRDT
ncbi:MAG: response regulator [Gemmatimonadales bacterium]